MKEYKVNKYIRKDDFLNAGFSYSQYNVLQLKRYIYKKDIILTITVDYTEDEIGVYTNITYANGNSYPTVMEYGKSDVRDIVLENYEKEMNRLVRKKLIKEVR